MSKADLKSDLEEHQEHILWRLRMIKSIIDRV